MLIRTNAVTISTAAGASEASANRPTVGRRPRYLLGGRSPAAGRRPAAAGPAAAGVAAGRRRRAGAARLPGLGVLDRAVDLEPGRRQRPGRPAGRLGEAAPAPSDERAGRRRRRTRAGLMTSSPGRWSRREAAAPAVGVGQLAEQRRRALRPGADDQDAAADVEEVDRMLGREARAADHPERRRPGLRPGAQPRRGATLDPAADGQGQRDSRPSRATSRPRPVAAVASGRGRPRRRGRERPRPGAAIAAAGGRRRPAPSPAPVGAAAAARPSPAPTGRAPVRRRRRRPARAIVESCEGLRLRLASANPLRTAYGSSGVRSGSGDCRPSPRLPRSAASGPMRPPRTDGHRPEPIASRSRRRRPLRPPCPRGRRRRPDAAPAEAAEGLDDGALGGADRLERDRAVGVDLGLEPGGRGGGSLVSRCWRMPGRVPTRASRTWVVGDLVEDRAEVGAVEEVQVFEVNEVRQGSPPDRWGRVG